MWISIRLGVEDDVEKSFLFLCSFFVLARAPCPSSFIVCMHAGQRTLIFSFDMKAFGSMRIMPCRRLTSHDYYKSTTLRLIFQKESDCLARRHTSVERASESCDHDFGFVPLRFLWHVCIHTCSHVVLASFSCSYYLKTPQIFHCKSIQSAIYLVQLPISLFQLFTCIHFFFPKTNFPKTLPKEVSSAKKKKMMSKFATLHYTT